jgi:serine/threonine protein kinase
MTYPTLEQYQEVLQHPTTAFLDPELARGHVATTGLGMPLAMCGGFVLTYTVTTGGRKLAVRCFHKESRELQQRYDAVSRTLRGLRSPYFVSFDFLKAGVRVNGAGYPVVKMDWAQGTTLGEFVEQHYRDGNRLSKLIESLRRLAQYLESQGVAHGDIQPGNVMVSGDGAAVQLIDYDGMYVPSLAQMRSAELRHRNFQHPGRSEKHFDAKLDRFSFISLDLALRALKASPQLWAATQSEPESFVFRANDFAAPIASPTFAALSRLNDCSNDAANFAAICSTDMSLTPTLADFISGRGIPTAPKYKAPAVGAPFSRTAYLAQHPVLDASDYGIVSKHIGQLVELVGKVIGVADDKKSRGGRPYVFLNFGDWRGTCVKLAIWSDVLEKMTGTPDKSWIGRW